MKPRHALSLLLLALPLLAAGHPGDQFTHYAGFELERATLADIQARLGPSRVHEQGDASDYEAWICYAGSNGEVRFNSGEMGGGTYLLGVTLVERAARRCPVPRKPLPASIGPVHLGQSVAEFTAAAGSAVKWSGHTATVAFDYAATNAQGERVDVSVSVLGTFQLGRLVKIQTWKIESL